MIVPSGKGGFPSRLGLNRFIVAQNGANIVEAALFVGYGDQPPVAVPRGDFFYEDRGSPFIDGRPLR